MNLMLSTARAPIVSAALARGSPDASPTAISIERSSRSPDVSSPLADAVGALVRTSTFRRRRSHHCRDDVPGIRLYDAQLVSTRMSAPSKLRKWTRVDHRVPAVDGDGPRISRCATLARRTSPTKSNCTVQVKVPGREQRQRRDGRLAMIDLQRIDSSSPHPRVPLVPRSSVTRDSRKLSLQTAPTAPAGWLGALVETRSAGSKHHEGALDSQRAAATSAWATLDNTTSDR